LAVPVVLGPVNGGVPGPKGFTEERRREGEWLGRLRGAYRLLPYYRSVREHASAIVVGSAAAWREMPRAYDEKMFYLPENAIDDRQFSRTTDVYDANPVKVAFVGRMVACKGIEMLIRAAVPLLKDGRVVIDLIGDGPEKPMLLKLVESEGVAHAVRLDGWVPHTELQDRLMQSAVLGFPSIREFGGGAVMEAMMLGLIPVVVGYGGPHEIVDSSCGFRVPLGTREEVIQGLRATLTTLAGMSGQERRRLGEAAHARITNEFSLPAKRDKTRAIYEWLVGIGEKPTHLRPPPEALDLYKSSFAGLF
jgi:glycosyltransferase involved in cell wall biosynthesis